MTKEELEVKVSIQKDIISKAKSQICKDVEEYIASLPYKVDDKISCIRCDVCWISSIRPNGSTGFVEIRVNPAKKDGTVKISLKNIAEQRMYGSNVLLFSNKDLTKKINLELEVDGGRCKKGIGTGILFADILWIGRNRGACFDSCYL